MSNKKALYPCEKCGKPVEKRVCQVPDGTSVFCSSITVFQENLRSVE